MDNRKGTATFTASVNLVEGNVVKLKADTFTEVELTSATDSNAIGTVIDDAQAGDAVAIRLLGISNETAIALAGEAISAGSLVVLGASGKVEALAEDAGTYNCIGVALTDSYADGNQIEIIHRQASQIIIEEIEE